MSILAALLAARAELMYRLCLVALALAGEGREAIPAMVRLFQAVEYWDERRACSRARV